MKIYTKKGDDGFTDEPDGERVGKCDVRCDAGGEVDELGAHIGWCIEAASRQDDIRDDLEKILENLFAVGSMLADGGSGKAPLAGLGAKVVADVEKRIDDVSASLPDLKRFILPGGGELACRLQIARTIARRAERSLVAMIDAGRKLPGDALAYLNRIGDLLFVLSRLAVARAGRDERTWTP